MSVSPKKMTNGKWFSEKNKDVLNWPIFITIYNVTFVPNDKDERKDTEI